MAIPRYFDLEELLQSDTALGQKIENLPSWNIVENLYNLALLLDKIREKYGSAIKVNSGYRSPKLNSAVGGSKTSNHMSGQAADIVPADGDTARLFNLIKSMMDNKEIEVGQLIWEYGTKKKPKWVHLSTPTEKHHNQILYLY